MWHYFTQTGLFLEVKTSQFLFKDFRIFPSEIFLSKTSIFGDLVLHVTESIFAGKQPYVTDAFYKIIFLVILLAKMLEIHYLLENFFFLNELYFTSFLILHTCLTGQQLATRYLELPLGVIYSRTAQFRLLTYRC